MPDRQVISATGQVVEEAAIQKLAASCFAQAIKSTSQRVGSVIGRLTGVLD